MDAVERFAQAISPALSSVAGVLSHGVTVVAEAATAISPHAHASVQAAALHIRAVASTLSPFLQTFAATAWPVIDATMSALATFLTHTGNTVQHTLSHPVTSSAVQRVAKSAAEMRALVLRVAGFGGAGSSAAELSPLISSSSVIIGVSLLLITMLLCVLMAARGSRATIRGGSAAGDVRGLAPTADVSKMAFVCTACLVALPDGDAAPAVARHTEGKKHARAVVALGAAASPMLWIREVDFEAMRLVKGQLTVSSGEQLAVPPEGRDPTAPIQQHGGASHSGTCGVNAASEGALHPLKGMGATTLTAPPSLIIQGLQHHEGSRNILEGVSLLLRVASPAQETAALRAVEASIIAAQSRRLRRDTFVPSRAAVAAQLHFGCFVDAYGTPQPAKLVEPMPPALLELACTLARRAEVAGWAPGSALPTALTVHIAEAGMHVPPLTLSGPPVFFGPAFSLQLGSPGEDLLVGETIAPVTNASTGAAVPGEFLAGYSMSLHKRAAMWGGDWNEKARVLHALAAVKPGSRVVLCEFRCLAPGHLGQAKARGNAM